MRGGRLDIRLTIQSATTSTSSTGAKQKSWATYSTVWAEKSEGGKSGASEKTHSEQLTPIHNVMWKLRYSNSSKAITPKMRAVEGGRIYNIISVQEAVHRQWIMLNCEIVNSGAGSSTPAACEPATYQNSDGSYTQEIASNATGTGPDITVTDADTTTRAVPANTDVACAFPSLDLVNSNDTNIGSVSAYPTGGEVDVPDTPITNTDGSRAINAPSGETYTAPDITMTEVNGSSTTAPSLKDLVCAWATIRVDNTVGTSLLSIAAYPVGGVATLPDALVTVNNSDGDAIETNVDYGYDNIIELDDIEIEDSGGATFDVPVAMSIILPDTTIDAASVTGGVLTIETPTAATPSGICYRDTFPAFNESFVTGDSWDNFTSGNYNRTPPTYPEAFAMLKYNATQADVRGVAATGTSLTDAVAPTILEENNAFGNKFRYTDDAGNESDATVGSNLWAHVDWNNHSWTGATSYYVIDHLTGWGFTVKYEDDSGKVNLSTTGNNWAGWMAYINGTHYSMTGWMPLDLGDVNNAHGARVQPNMVWADEFFEFDSSVSGSARGGFITGESYASTIFYHLYDSGNPDMVLDLTKAKDNGFQSRLTNCFMKRKHY